MILFIIVILENIIFHLKNKYLPNLALTCKKLSQKVPLIIRYNLNRFPLKNLIKSPYVLEIPNMAKAVPYIFAHNLNLGKIAAKKNPVNLYKALALCMENNNFESFKYLFENYIIKKEELTIYMKKGYKTSNKEILCLLKENDYSIRHRINEVEFINQYGFEQFAELRDFLHVEELIYIVPFIKFETAKKIIMENFLNKTKIFELAFNNNNFELANFMIQDYIIDEENNVKLQINHRKKILVDIKNKKNELSMIFKSSFPNFYKKAFTFAILGLVLELNDLNIMAYDLEEYDKIIGTKKDVEELLFKERNSEFYNKKIVRMILKRTNEYLPSYIFKKYIKNPLEIEKYKQRMF